MLMQNPSCIRFRGAFCNTRGCRRGLKVASRLFGKPLTFQPQGKKEGSRGINATSHIVHNLLDISTNFLLVQKKHVLSPFFVVTFLSFNQDYSLYFVPKHCIHLNNICVSFYERVIPSLPSVFESMLLLWSFLFERRWFLVGFFSGMQGYPKMLTISGLFNI